MMIYDVYCQKMFYNYNKESENFRKEKLMKRIYSITFIVVIVFALISVILYIYYYDSKSSNLMMSILEICMDSLLTGAVTFIGLIVTFSFQRKQDKENYEKNICPCIVVQTADKARPSQKNINPQLKETELLLTDAKNVRTLDCKIFNPTSNCILNVKIHIGQNEVPIELSGKSKIYKCHLASGIESEILFTFEDIFGNRYMQKIKYKQETSLNYVFHYSPPRKLKKREEVNNGKN